MDKQKEFKQRVNCGIAYCEDTPSKQKEIEEMAKVIGFTCEKENCSQCKYKNRCVYYKESKLFYNAGYRNCKDKVVLSREDYNLLISIKKFFETAGSEISAGNLLVYLKEFKEEASKETAEKFVNIPDSDILVVDTQEYGEIEVVSVERLRELAKQFGVEIKE